MSIQFPDLTDTIFFEGGKTDKLLAELEKQRVELQNLHADSVTKGLELSEVVADLHLMEEKTLFFAEMIDSTQGVFTPPPKGDAEVGMEAIRNHVFGNIDKFTMVTGLLASPLIIHFLGHTVQYVGWASKTGRIAGAMKGAKYIKLMKFAKGAVVLAAAAELASFVMGLVASKQMNDKLRAELRDLKAKGTKGTRDYNKLVAGLADAKAQRDDMLAQAGAATPEDYVRTINEGLAQMGRQKANFDTARRMVRHELPDETILTMLDGLSEEALSDIKVRLQAEIQLAAGIDQATVASEAGLALDQVATIAFVIDARNALVRGKPLEEMAETIPIGSGQLDDIDDQLDEALPDHWGEIEGDGPLAALASQLLLSEAALHDLRVELSGKSLLSGGQDVGAVSEALGVARDVVVSWASALPVALEAVHTQREGGVSEPADLAAGNRLPLRLVAAG